MLSLILAFVFAAVDEKILQESEFYLEEIRKANPTSQKKINFRTGLIQVVDNSGNIDLNSDGTLAMVGAEAIWKLSEFWGIELRYLYAVNAVYAPIDEDVNGTDANYTTTDFGIRYIWEFNPARRGDYFAAKLMLHNMSNNFELTDNTTQFLVTSYSGPILGIERGLSITDKIHLTASLDLLIITNTEFKSDLSVDQDGLGLFVRGEFFYLLNWLSKRDQIGLSYWQAAYSNRYNDFSRSLQSKENFVTTYRMLSVSYSFLF